MTLSVTTAISGPSAVDNHTPTAIGFKAKSIAIAISVECARGICGIVQNATSGRYVASEPCEGCGGVSNIYAWYAQQEARDYHQDLHESNRKYGTFSSFIREGSTALQSTEQSQVDAAGHEAEIDEAPAARAENARGKKQENEPAREIERHDQGSAPPQRFAGL